MANENNQAEQRLSWTKIQKAARMSLRARGLGQKYSDRLDFEIAEVNKQGASRYWEEVVAEGRSFSKNPNKLLLPWLLGLCEGEADADPYADSEPFCTADYYKVLSYLQTHGELPVGIYADRDQPDIDIDCLPEARDEIKAYASKRYGVHNVCSVGTMNSYLLKQALQDCAKALNMDKSEIIGLTTLLPDTVNELREGGYGVCTNENCKTKHKETSCPKCGTDSTETPTFAQLLDEHDAFREYYERSPAHKHVVDTALGLIGRYKSLGKHAGALIIANCNLFGNVPMYKKNDQWVSMWTEGRSPQLSKFGYNKWDILGLKNLKYIFECCKLIERNHGISFGERMAGMDENDPSENKAFVYWKDGKKYKVPLDDPKALKLANESRTDAVFQFDTELAKSILANGVRNFSDLLTFNAMGHPGPLQCVWSGSKINTDQGLIEIAKLSPQQHKLAYVNKDSDLSYTNDYLVFGTGTKRLLEIEMGNGKVLRVTPDHEVLTDKGWVRADELTGQHQIAVVDELD